MGNTAGTSGYQEENQGVANVPFAASLSTLPASAFQMEGTEVAIQPPGGGAEH